MALRVNCYGSVFYRIGLALREHTDLDVHVFIDERTLALNTALREEAALTAADWIHVERLVDRAAFVAPWRAPATRRLAAGDVVLTSEAGPIFAQFTGRPNGFLAVGGDLTVSPFPMRSRFLRPRRREQASAAVIAGWQRRGIRRSDRIWATPFGPYQLALDRLGVSRRRERRYLPIAVDSELFRDDAKRRAAAASAFPAIAACSFVALHPSRLMIDPHPFLVETGQWKRNEVALQGFARFAASGPVDARLVLVDQTYSPDRALARRLAEELGIADRIIWVRPGSEAGFSWRQMRDLYLLADVVLDDFGAGWFGMVVLEAAAVARPIITHVDDEVMQELYGTHPLLEAEDPAQVAALLTAVASDPGSAAAHGEAGRRWIEEFHAPAAIAARYLDAIEDLAGSV